MLAFPREKPDFFPMRHEYIFKQTNKEEQPYYWECEVCGKVKTDINFDSENCPISEKIGENEYNSVRSENGAN